MSDRTLIHRHTLREELQQRGLYRHQVELVCRVLERPRYCVFSDPGTGKTRTVLESLRAIKKAGVELAPTLILCPLTIIRSTWLGDCRRFTPELALREAIGSKAQRLEALRAAYRREVDAVVMNYEAALRHARELNLVPWRGIVLDESARVKNPSAKTTRLVHRLTKTPEMVLCLSGCPIPNGLMDLWGQVEAVAPGHLGANFWAFRAGYFYKINEFKWLPRRDGVGQIMDKARQVATFLKQRDCVDLPPQQFITRHVDLSRKEQEAYDTFVREWVLSLDEETTVTAPHKLTELMKCRQMTAGLVHVGEGEWRTLGRSKLDALLELAGDELGPDEPLIVVAQFRAEIDRLKRELRWRTPAVIYGGLSATERDKARDDFLTGTNKTLIVHPAAASEGLNLQGMCRWMAFVSLSYDYHHHYQMLQRIHRIGTTSSCSYVFFVAKGTIDEQILAAVQRKEKIGDELVSTLRLRYS